MIRKVCKLLNANADYSINHTVSLSIRLSFCVSMNKSFDFLISTAVCYNLIFFFFWVS